MGRQLHDERRGAVIQQVLGDGPHQVQVGCCPGVGRPLRGDVRLQGVPLTPLREQVPAKPLPQQNHASGRVKLHDAVDTLHSRSPPPMSLKKWLPTMRRPTLMYRSSSSRLRVFLRVCQM